MADSVYGVMWLSSLLMSMLWIEWPMVAVGLWYGQAYVKDNEHRCILLMAFWMHRDTVTRSWGSLLCHSSTTITSCSKDLYTIPVSWKHPSSCLASILSPDMSPIEHVWDALDRRIRQRVPVPANIQQQHSHWRGVDQHSTGHNQQPDQLYVKEMCCTAWGKWWSHQILTGFRTPPNTVKLHILEWHFGTPVQ